MFDLYRPEAVEYARVARLGDVSSATPYRGWRIWGFVISAFLSMVLLLFLVRIPQHEVVPGRVKTEGASIRIDSKGNWLVGDVFVRSGQRVRKGQPLFTASEVQGSLADNDVQRRMLNSVSVQEAALRQQSLVADTSYRDQARQRAEKISALGAAREHLNVQIGLQINRTNISQQTLADAEKLLRKGFVSRIEYQRREDALIAARQEKVALQRQDDSLRAEIAQEKLAFAQLNASRNTESGRLRGEIAQAEENRAKVEGAANFVVRAPTDGILADWSLAPNTTMPDHTLAGTLSAPPHQLIGELFMPTRSSGFLQEGQSVLLDYDGFPASQFGFGKAIVVSISRVPVAGGDTPSGSNATEGGYRVILKLSSYAPRTNMETWQFRDGLRFQAHFVLNKVPLWRKLFSSLVQQGN